MFYLNLLFNIFIKKLLEGSVIVKLIRFNINLTEILNHLQQFERKKKECRKTMTYSDTSNEEI